VRRLVVESGRTTSDFPISERDFLNTTIAVFIEINVADW